jgi:hypothetical protein
MERTKRFGVAMFLEQLFGLLGYSTANPNYSPTQKTD